MKLTVHTVEQVLGAVLATKDEEVGCGECYEQMEQFVEMKLEGKSPEEAMPLVKEHLQQCNDCNEEYEVLLEALQALNQ